MDVFRGLSFDVVEENLAEVFADSGVVEDGGAVGSGERGDDAVAGEAVVMASRSRTVERASGS